jgi:hypothetical protein
MELTSDRIALGITEDEIPLGSHVIHFWRTDEEFERGVRFLELGIDNKSQQCMVFGHDEANERVLEVLGHKTRELDRARAEGRLVFLRRESSASMTLAASEAALSAAVQRGVTAIRYLGLLGMGRDPLPGRGGQEVAELEGRVTALILRYPCVLVCMYDVNTVSSQLMLTGFGTHPLAVWQNALRENPYYTSEQASVPSRGSSNE